jgi:hypothetical protein
MTKPTGRPRGRPPKNIEDADPKTISGRAIHAMREAEDDRNDPTTSEDFLTQELAKPVAYGRRRKLEPDDNTLRLIGELSKLFATQAEIAGILGVHRETLRLFMNEFEEAREVYENGLQHAKISLRRKQLALADKNAPAGIFLGKNYLGQKDEHHTTTTVNTPAAELSEAELLEIIARESKAGKAKPTMQ